MFDRDAALARAAQLEAPSLTAVPVAVISHDLKLAASLRRQLTAARDLAVAEDVGRARVVLWDAREVETEEGLPKLPETDGATIVALVSETDDPMPLLAVGVQGLVARDAPTARLRAAVLAADLGLVVLDDDPTDAVVANWSPSDATPEPAPVETPRLRVVDDLTPREHQVLGELAEGLSNRAIGERLGISAHTVKFHVDALLHKLDARSRTQAVVHAIRRGVFAV